MNNKIVNDKIIDFIFVLLGIVGTIIVIYGQNSTLPRPAYALGSVLLFVTAVHYKLVFFIALELIQTATHTAALINVSPHIQSAIPVLLSLQLLLYYFMTGPRNVFLFFGVMGMMLLSIGFAYESHYLSILGAMGITLYAYYCVYKGDKICYLWVVLNLIFIVTGIYQLIQG